MDRAESAFDGITALISESKVILNNKGDELNFLCSLGISWPHTSFHDTRLPRYKVC